MKTNDEISIVRLNDNEVSTVAKMQMKIDCYESFISTIHVMVATGKTDLNYLLFEGTDFTKEMNRIWRFVKQEIKDNESKKDSETA